MTGWWSVSEEGAERFTPDILAVMQARLDEALNAGKHIVVVEGITLTYHPAMVYELPESILSNLRSHAFPTCLICGAYVDDPEAIEYCDGPNEQEKRNHDVAVVNATNRNAVNR